MAKKKSESYLAPSKVLSPEEAKKYAAERKQLAAMNYRRRIGEMGSEIKYKEGKSAYAKTASGKFGKGISSVLGLFQPGAARTAAYKYTGQAPPQNLARRFKTVQGIKTGHKGRPKGTIDKRYAPYGGVYGYRKALALRNAQIKLQMQRQARISPQQEQVLHQVALQQRAQQINPESQTFPDTTGHIPMKKIFQDIDDATKTGDGYY